MPSDSELLQIIDSAMAESMRRSGPRVVCRSGCTACCHGPFEISQLDAHRLREGLAALTATDPIRAGQVRQRARSVLTLANQELGDDDPCPALDPLTGACELYAHRPITCRTFGPPVRYMDDAVSVCELNFIGASDAEIARCAVDVDPDGIETALITQFAERTGLNGVTTVAAALSTEQAAAGALPLN